MRWEKFAERVKRPIAYSFEHGDESLPEAFRGHILENYAVRMKRHEQLEHVDSVEIRNDPCVGHRYQARIYGNGMVDYRNAED